MIAETPQALVFSLVATTLLGVVMGYCIALIRARRAAAVAMESAQEEFSRENAAAKTDLRSTRASIDNLRNSLNDSNSRAKSAMKREEALEMNSQLQAERIATLESHVSSYEDQQIRLKRDFANYKSNTMRELEQARRNSGERAKADRFPVLSKRIPADQSQTADTQNPQRAPTADTSAQRFQTHAAGSGSTQTGLKTPLSRELDIPSLSESELPDSVDEFEFEMSDLDSTGGWPRG